MQRDLMSTSEIALIEKLFFRHGCGHIEEQLKAVLDNIAGIHRFLKHVDVMKRKQDIAEALRMETVMSVSDRVKVGPDWV